MLIQILGTGCAKCDLLAHDTEQAAKSLGIDFTLEKISDFGQIMSYGVMVTPALVVDGKVKCSGYVPGIEQIKRFLQENLP